MHGRQSGDVILGTAQCVSCMRPNLVGIDGKQVRWAVGRVTQYIVLYA